MANENRIAADGNNRIAADANNRVTPEVIPDVVLVPADGFGLNVGSARRFVDANGDGRTLSADIGSRSVN